MQSEKSLACRWCVVAAYAVAMAWVEAAVVFYLRTLVDRIQPYQNIPLPMKWGLEQAELIREAATLAMLWAVGWFAGKNWRSRLGYAAVAFGLWDIFYYVFLRVMTGWPNSIFDWDILFLLPMPWWGPVWSPVAIAVLMIVWGALAQFENGDSRLHWKSWLLNFTGIFVALYVFMADAIRALGGGEAAMRNVLPQQFNWPLFCVALALMAAQIVRQCCEIWLSRRLLTRLQSN